MSQNRVIVIGAGLAGSEAALQLAERGIEVELYEMRPSQMTGAHQSSQCAELVCSNSLGSLSAATASNTLKEELTLLGSQLLVMARESQVPAGASLAVDREKFADAVTQKISQTSEITLIREELKEIPVDAPAVILATGPLTSESLANHLAKLLGTQSLYFYDAISPIVATDSLDLEQMYFKSRYDKGNPDFLNIALSEEQYDELVNDLLVSEQALAHDFEKEKYFESCLPIEVLAARGRLTLAYGPLKPVGLHDPKSGKRPFAVVQLRAENSHGSAYNLVGFQTKLKYPEQKRVFQKLPGLQNAEFLRLGSIHRNTFVDSPRVLSPTLQLNCAPNVFLAGQLTGTEGYLESTASGLVAAFNAIRRLRGQTCLELPKQTILGALLAAITDPKKENFQPTNVNRGLFPPLDVAIRDKKLKYQAMRDRALDSMKVWLEQNSISQNTAKESYTRFPEPIGESAPSLNG